MVREASGNGTPSIADISDDVLVSVFLKIPDPIDLGRCLRTCKNWRRVICDGALDNSYWLNKARADLPDLLDEDGNGELDLEEFAVLLERFGIFEDLMHVAK